MYSAAVLFAYDITDNIKLELKNVNKLKHNPHQYD